MTNSGSWNVPPVFEATPQPPRSGGGRGAIIAISAVAALAIVGVVALLVGALTPNTVPGTAVAGEQSGAASTSATPATPELDAAALPALLSKPDEVNEIMGRTDLYADLVYTAPDEPTPDTSYTPPECVGAVFSGMGAAYNGNGYQDIYQQRTTNSSAPDAVSVDQGVALFASPEAAEEAFDGYLDLLRQCTGAATMTMGQPPTTAAIDIGAPRDEGGITTLRNSIGGTYYVDRALSVKDNVIVDVQISAMTPHDQALGVARRILERI